MLEKRKQPDLLQLARDALRLARALERGLDEALGPDVPFGGQEYLLLRLVQLGYETPGDLARELNAPAANVSRALQRLTALELLDRKVDPSDQRRALLHLTAAGEATVDFARERVTVWLQEVFARSSDVWLVGTQRRLARLLEQLAAGPPAPPT
jgi:DNA-binding MarR family transcriptional regulator